jgi:hypothetical protein
MATIGATAPSQNTINYDSLLSTTLASYRDTMVDNIFKSNGFLAALKSYGGIEYQDGGERIAQPLMYEDNGTVKSYSGYDTLDTTPQDGMTTAFFPWCEVAGTISISRLEERKNSGESAILKLLEKKILQAEMSLKAAINSQLVLGTVSGATFVPGNSTKDLFPLGYFLRKVNSTDPTTGGNVGNIAGATYSWWRHKTGTFASASADTGNSLAIAVTTYKGMKNGLYRLYNWCSRGADGTGPNILLGDQVSYETYVNAIQDQRQYQDDKLAQIGFDNIKVRAATFIWDELVPDVSNGTAAITLGSVFALNTKFYKLVIDSQTDFVTTPFIEPENQTAKTAKILFMGNATVSNMRKLGVAYGVAQTIVS